MVAVASASFGQSFHFMSLKYFLYVLSNMGNLILRLLSCMLPMREIFGCVTKLNTCILLHMEVYLNYSVLLIQEIPHDVIFVA